VLSLYFIGVLFLSSVLFAPSGSASESAVSSSTSAAASMSSPEVKEKKVAHVASELEKKDDDKACTTAKDNDNNNRNRNLKRESLSLSHIAERFTRMKGRIPNIIIRKYYHLLATTMFVPAILLEVRWVSLAFAVAMALFIVLEYIRIARVPPFGHQIHSFMRSYLDERDEGIIILTHTYLLTGCAIPIWLHCRDLVAACEALLKDTATLPPSHTQTTQTLLVNGDGIDFIPAMTGVLILGVGDSMASLVGIYLGRIRWPGTHKTVAGTIGAIISILSCVAIIQAMGIHLLALPIKVMWMSLSVSAIMTCLLEAFTMQIDNLFLPPFFYASYLSMKVLEETYLYQP
jgi:dolichol kinase